MSEANEAAASAPEALIEIALIPLSRVDESPFNPRHTFEKAALAELAADIARRGVLQPVLVREKPGKAGRRFELVVGARRLRASRLAKAETIPAIVREMSDQEVLETQIAENAQRADIHPLEEGDGYRRLHEQYHVSIDEIAARVSKSRRAVYARIQLSRLREPGRKALLAGKLTASTALLAATLHDPKAQDEYVAQLVAWCTDYRREVEPLSYQEALEQLREEFDLRLERAPWKLDDVALVPTAGACTVCPKRSSAQAELFDEADRDRADVCMDRGCWQGKREAWALDRLAQARAEGRPVLEGAAAKKALGGHGTHVDVEDRAYVYGVRSKAQDKPLRKLLGKKLPPTSVVLDAKGDLHEVVERGELKKALRAGGYVEKSGVRSAQSVAQSVAQSPAQLRTAKIARFRNLVAAKARAAIVDRVQLTVDDADPSSKLWGLICRALVDECWHESLKGLVARRGWAVKQHGGRGGRNPDVRALAEQQAKSAVAGFAVGLAVELAISRPIASSAYRAETREHPYGERLEDAAECAGIDLEQLEADVAGYLAGDVGPKETERGKGGAKKKAHGKSKGGRGGKPKGIGKPRRKAKANGHNALNKKLRELGDEASP